MQKVPLQKVIFDTDVLIWYFKGSAKAAEFVNRVAYPQRAISALVLMELVQGCRSRAELQAVKLFVNENIHEVLHPSEEISILAQSLLEQHAHSDGLRVVDALIAATAIKNGTCLATANVRHYRAVSALRLIPFRS